MIKNRRYRLLLLILAACILVLTVIRLVFFSRTESYSSSSLSSGVIADLPLNRDTVYETEISGKKVRSGMGGIGIHINYPVGRTFRDESVHILISEKENGLVLYDGLVPIRNTGYAGDTVNEGVLIAAFDEPYSGGQDLRIRLASDTIASSQGVTVRTRQNSGVFTGLSCSGEPADGYLYAAAYVPASQKKTGKIIGDGFLLLLTALLLCTILSDRTGRPRSKGGKARKQGLQKQNLLCSLFPVRFRTIPLKKWLLLVLLLIVQVLVLEFGYYAGVSNAAIEQIEHVRKSGSTYDWQPGESLQFYFTATSNELSGIGLSIDTGHQNDQVLRMNVTEISDEQEKTVSDYLIRLDTVLSSQTDGYRILEFPERIRNSLHKEYRVDLNFAEGSESLKTILADSDPDAAVTPYYKEIYSNRRFIVKLYILLGLLTLAGTCILWYQCVSGTDWKRSAMLALVVLGLCFTALIKPFSIADEYTHFDSAYRISNRMLGIPESPIGESMYRRACDTVTDVLNKEKMNSDAFKWEIETLREEIRNWPNRYNEDMQLVYSRTSGTDTNWLYYFPAAVGMTAGRLLGFGLIGIFYGGRLVNFLLALLMIRLAMQRIPWGKASLALIALMPVTLSMTASLSYDALLIPIAFCTAAWSMQIISRPEEATNTDIVLLIVLTVLLALAKAGAYLPIGILSIYAVIMYVKTGTWTLRASAASRIRRKNRKLYIALFAILAGAVLVFVIARYGKTYTSILKAGQSSAYNSRREKAVYTTYYLLRHPKQLFRILEGTLYWRSQVLLDIAGATIGWVYMISISAVIRCFSIVLIVLSAVRDVSESRIGKTARALCITAFVICVVGFHYAMLTGWTQFGMKYVSGTQSRYFIPVLPLLLAAMQMKSFERKEDSNQKMIIAAYVLGVLDAMSFVITAFG